MRRQISDVCFYILKNNVYVTGGKIVFKKKLFYTLFCTNLTQILSKQMLLIYLIFYYPKYDNFVYLQNLQKNVPINLFLASNFRVPILCPNFI